MSVRFLASIRAWQIVLLFSLIYLSAIFVINNGDLKTFVNIGSCFSDCDGVNQTPCGDDEMPCEANCDSTDTCEEDCVECTECEEGYDGQFVYYIARDPGNAESCIDVPAYRYQRILLPIMGRVLAVGNTDLLPLAFVVINLIALVGSTALVEDLLEHTPATRWYALVYGLSLGMVISVRLSTTEPLAYGLVALAIWLSQRHREQVILQAAILALAILTKEVTALFAAGFVMYYGLHRRWKDAFLTGFISMLPFIIWQIVLYNWLGGSGVGSGGNNATGFEIIPYAGIWRIALLGDTLLAGLLIFLLIGVLIMIPTAVIPSVWGIYSTGKRLWAHRQPEQWAEIDLYTCLFFTSVIIMPFIPLSTFAEPLGLTRFIVGMILMHVLYAATWHPGTRPLKYSPLWLVWLVWLSGG